MSNSASLYRAFGCFARCAPDSWFPGLAQQHYEVNDLEANERIEEPDASQEDDITDAFNDAGSACEICNDDDAVRSHFAVPCRHTACGSCWGQWLECSDKCMICGGHVEKSHRFAESVVPLSIQERLAKSPQAKTRKGDISEADALEMDVPELYLLNQTLEGVLADVIRDLVKTKDMVTTIAEKIETCTEHLAAIPGMDFDAQMSVIVVEKSTLGEALQALSGCLNRAHSDAWAGTYTGVHRLQQEINKLGDMLDACSDEQPTGLETTRRILQNCTASTLKGQWDPLRQQLNRIHQALVPRALQLLTALCRSRQEAGELGQLGHIAAHLAQHADQELASMAAILSELIPEVEIMLVRVESWFGDYLAD